MTAREMLEGITRLRAQVAALETECAALQERALRRGGAAPGGRLTLAQEELKRAYKLLKRRLKDLSRYAADLPRLAERQVLALRYIEGMRYEEISEALYFSPRHVYRLHGSAVVHLQETMP